MAQQPVWQRMLESKREPDIHQVVEAALADGSVLKELLDGLGSKSDTYRYNCFKALDRVAGDQPAHLYPAWDRLAGLLDSDNAYHRSIAVRLLARLACADVDNRFEDLADRYFALLDDKSVMTSRYVAQSAGEIARCKPHLRSRITERLLCIDQTGHPQGRKELIKADAIQTFAEFFVESPDKERILDFVNEQLQSGSPTTRRAAKGFLDRFGRS